MASGRLRLDHPKRMLNMQQIGSWREVVHVGSRDGDRLDQA